MEAGKHIELSIGQEPGEFRLSLDGIAITIHMKDPMSALAAGTAPLNSGNGSAAPSPPAIAGPAAEGSQDTAQISAELDHYRQVSQDIYEGLGKLAKDINLSIQDLSLAELIQTSMGSPGEHLDQARTQVTDVLKMTEKATMNIMDLVDRIREDCTSVQTNLLQLKAGPADGEPGELTPDLPLENPEDQGRWDQVLSQAEELDLLLSSPDTREGAPSEGIPLFSLSDILQILLEFCTNEKVKQHLKAVQAKQDAIFRTTEAERALSLLGTGVPQEDGFHQLPVEPLLNILKSHCDDERVKDLLTKMISSADKLFPLPALPLEAQGMEEGFADEAGEAQGNPEVTARWAEFKQALALLAENRGNGMTGAAAPMPHVGGEAEVQVVLDAVDRITENLSRIVEALSFQDLSGQRLLKILGIIRQLQVQVLTLLVAAGQKLLVNLDDQPLLPHESDQARKELDRLLHSSAPPLTEESIDIPDGPLDQDAINDILTGMGF